MLARAHRRGLLRSPLRGRAARLEALRAAVPVAILFASIPLAYALRSATVLLWWSIWSVDSLLARLEAVGPSRARTVPLSAGREPAAAEPPSGRRSERPAGGRAARRAER